MFFLLLHHSTKYSSCLVHNLNSFPPISPACLLSLENFEISVRVWNEVLRDSNKFNALPHRCRSVVDMNMWKKPHRVIKCHHLTCCLIKLPPDKSEESPEKTPTVCWRLRIAEFRQTKYHVTWNQKIWYSIDTYGLVENMPKIKAFNYYNSAGVDANTLKLKLNVIF